MGRIRKVLGKVGKAVKWMDETCLSRSGAKHLAGLRGQTTNKAVSYGSLFPRGKAVYNPKTVEVEFRRKSKVKARTGAPDIAKPKAYRLKDNYPDRPFHATRFLGQIKKR